ncbi:hypothetical protein G4H71_07000 [Rhodococcus triatomae]|uniref:Septum formation n=1 Tax=Rhodococcus triatomae TaxID=300028 RepID=A0A1G8BA15_9NOCA|nr:septum formation family protein [Rhodococcus triatomae]QNG17518.1 hypothetical protein G4H72_01045 [Rhodococcus triatomae]QNG22814.1 hypothetical protein G4H71_07000 [Rhodococcus triatomae]SDH29863.1 Septum formation [Rhodococcus triatomae]
MATHRATLIRAGAAAVAVGGAMALTACSTSVDGTAVASDSGGVFATPDTTTGARPTSTTVEPEEVDVFDLKVGTCLVDDLGLGDESVTVQGGQQTVPCSEPHTFEVYAEHTMSGSVFPGEDETVDEASVECSDAFGSFVGISYDDSTLDLFYLYPTEDSWEDGDRIVSCLITDPAGPTSGSLRGAAR